MKLEIFPGANICGGVQVLNPVDFTDDHEAENRRDYNYSYETESGPSARPVYIYWTADIDPETPLAITPTWLESSVKAKQYSSYRPIKVFKRIKVPIYVKSTSSNGVLMQRSGLLDTTDVSLTLGQVFIGVGTVNNTRRQEYNAHCRVTYYTRLYGKRNI